MLQDLFQRLAAGAAVQGTNDAGVGDNDVRTGRKLREKGIDAGTETGGRFAAGRCVMKEVGGPGIDFLAGNVVPGPSFPVAEIDFLQALVHSGLRVQMPGQKAATLQRAAPDRGAGWQQGAQGGGNRQGVFGGNVEPAIADTRSDQRAWMTDQVERVGCGHCGHCASTPR